jgi:hypothetical protein
MLFSTSETYILIYDTQTNQFDKVYEIYISRMEASSFVISSSYFIFFFGKDVIEDNFLSIKAYASTIESIKYVGEGSISMNQIISDYIISPSLSLSFSHSTDEFSTAFTPTIGDPLTLSSSNTDYPSIWNDLHSEPFLLESSNYSLNFECSCKPLSSLLSVTYSLISIQSYPAPAWVMLDAAECTMELSTPDIQLPTEFVFGLETTWTGGNSIKEFHVVVSPWRVEKCMRWNGMSNVWGEWEEGYVLEGKECKEKEKEEGEGAAKTVSQVLLGIGVGVGITSAFLTSSSPQSAFSMINQFQMLLLLPLIGTYIPDEIVKLIVGMDFAMFSLAFIPIDQIPGFSYIVGILHENQKMEYLDTIGLQSRSSLVNSISLLFTMFLVLGIHGIVFLMYRKIKDISNPKLIHRAIIKVFEVLTLSFYIRILMEAFLFIWLSSFYEVRHAQFHSLTLIASFTISWVMIAFSIWGLGIIVHQIVIAHPQLDTDSQWVFRELFASLKDSTFSRLFPLIFWVNRALWVLIVVLLKDIVLDGKTILFSLLQFFVVAYLVLVRPFAAIKDSIIETTNQLILVILSSMLIYFKSKPDWNPAIEDTFTGLITSGVVIGIWVSLVDIIKTGVVKIRNYLEKRRSKLSKVSNDATNPNVMRYLPSSSISRSDITITTTQNDTAMPTSKGMQAPKVFDSRYSEVRPKYPKISKFN